MFEGGVFVAVSQVDAELGLAWVVAECVGEWMAGLKVDAAVDEVVHDFGVACVAGGLKVDGARIRPVMDHELDEIHAGPTDGVVQEVVLHGLGSAMLEENLHQAVEAGVHREFDGRRPTRLGCFCALAIGDPFLDGKEFSISNELAKFLHVFGLWLAAVHGGRKTRSVSDDKC